MVELTTQQRLQPALLDRLIDNEPEKKSELRESRLITRGHLRAAVLRDLAWLFNTVRLGGEVELAGCDHVRHSVLNFGLPAWSGRTASSLDMMEIERSIRQAILDFEPRIMPATLQVEALVSDVLLEQHNMVSMQIRGNLWAQPIALELLLRTDVDLETGVVQIRDLGKAG
jgi:type VI secretion system protein ImpF